jgi:hypothetical protein
MTDVNLDVYDVPLSDLEATLVGWAAEALDLRFGVVAGRAAPDLPPPQSGPSDVLEQLRAVRARLDGVERLLGSATRARGRAQRAATEAKALAEHAWDETANRARSGGARRGGEYEGARERYADWNLATIPQQRAARAAERLAGVATESLDVVRLTHRGLEGLRNDLHLMLRAMNVESALER